MGASTKMGRPPKLALWNRQRECGEDRGSRCGSARTLARNDTANDVTYGRARTLELFGIVIRMFVEAGGQHHRAHFHAYYQEQAAVFAVDTVECLGGSLPKAQQRLVEAWAEIHRAELQHDWDLLQSGQPPVKIEPLR